MPFGPFTLNSVTNVPRRLRHLRYAPLIAGAMLAAGLALAQSKPDTADLTVQEIDVSAHPITDFDREEPARARYRRLEWRGGLVLSSVTETFGGWSGLAFDPDGETLIAVSDAGSWMTARLVYDGKHPKGLASAKIGPLKARNGKPLLKASDRDAEAITFGEGTLAKGSLFIGFEQNGRIGRFPVADSLPAPPASYITLPPEARRMRTNSFEAVTVLRGGMLAGSVVAFAEYPLRGETRHAGWIWIGGLPKRFAMTDIGGFGITDAASLSDGSLLLLERRFRWDEGVKMRLRWVDASEIKPGAMVEGEVLLEAGMAHEIDNMEGLAVRERPGGETLITMISDDNFNRLLQRTVLLEFALLDREQAAKASEQQSDTPDRDAKP